MALLTKSFPDNLRNSRRALGMTQRELGLRLGFSEKTVSKWEQGNALPDIETLFSICEVLQIKLESLFSGGEHYFLGIDGGGTKTAMHLADERGTVLRTLYTDACNPVDIGIENAKQILKDGIFKIACGIPFGDISMFAGIAGGTSGDSKRLLGEFFDSFGFYAYQNDSDNVNNIAAGLGNRDGVAVTIGTGSCVYTQKSGVLRRIGGWGYLLDDGGSGYNLGRDALHAYFAAYDGSGEKTLLTEELDRMYTGGAHALLAHAYGGGKRAVASFAPVVFAACKRGDRIALEIFERNMKEIMRLVLVALRDFQGESVPVVFAGGLTGEELVVSWLERELGAIDGCLVSVLRDEPVKGAVILAQQLGGRKK